MAGLGAALWAGPLLPVRSVQVDGLLTLSADVVRRAAGVAEGTPLPRIDVAAAEEGVARLPQVESVEVTRGWPDSVVVTVVERVPVAVVAVEGRRVLVDRHGVPYDTVRGAPPAGVVPLEVTDPGPDDPATAAALAAVAALPADLRTSLAGVRAESADAVTLRLADGTTVGWGDGDRSGDKAAVLVALLDQLAAGTLEPAAELDLADPDAVVLR
ncbi:FtsQ-type POTRA domain-containing protein [Geodermatophilus sp. YIM 151500]|uniref:cell division protein FtsQ/DivIB n=1 Tax=Geodermatophilus sp. YIM 151500 TaxID=2984531 RepID=UPI0021E3CB5C|nr:FtsQ-type POTRA domain-containing protein [Geodermatophilus sp. YIM 151500]MCV2491737.1 FtsQ-type POTRA domain-containing protein [Geodermatophilus sp. YIM 151500]